MRPKIKIAVIGFVIACGTASSPTVHGGGLSLYEIATPDVGLAAAGSAARDAEFRHPW